MTDEANMLSRAKRIPLYMTQMNGMQELQRPKSIKPRVGHIQSIHCLWLYSALFCNPCNLLLCTYQNMIENCYSVAFYFILYQVI